MLKAYLLQRSIARIFCGAAFLVEHACVQFSVSSHRETTLRIDEFKCPTALLAKQSSANSLNPDFDPAVHLPAPTGVIARHRQYFAEAGCRHEHFRQIRGADRSFDGVFHDLGAPMRDF